MEFAVFLTKARENQEAAQLCRSHGLYNACAARAYYAMFQAAVAILLAQGFILNLENTSIMRRYSRCLQMN